MKVKELITLAIVSIALSPVASAGDKITFAIGADFHAQDIPAGLTNVKAFVDEAKKKKVDFIIELGDFCRLDEGSRPYHEVWNSFASDKYHVIGNHDMDSYNADEYVEGMGMPGRYYSFDKGDFHFIVLDGNNLFDGNTYTHYQYGNFYKPMEQRAFMDQ